MALTTSTDKIYKDRIRFIQASHPNFWVPFAVTTIILLLVVIFITTHNMRQSEIVIGNQIAEGGKRSILLYEAVVLGRIKFNEPINKQLLMRHLGNQEDFKFLAITDNKGKFLIHSDEQKINKHINLRSNKNNHSESFINLIISLLPNTDGEGTLWGFVEINNEHLFLMHRIFGENSEQGRMRARFPEINEQLEEDGVIHMFAAIHPTPLNDALTSYRKTALVMSLWVIGISSFVLWTFSLSFRIFNNRRRMTMAESTITTMHEEVQRLESEIQKQEKLVAIGNLAAGVAHEIRNPLSSIKGYATYFANLFPKESENQKAAQMMISEVERLNRVIGDLIGVSRPTDIQIEAISIKSIIDSTIQLLAQDAKQLGIELNVSGVDKIAHIDPDRFKQALINILLNALEAFKENDFLNQMTEPPKVDILLSETLQDLFIEVSDNGPGVDKEHQRRIFDPYFTTKHKGTGLGLVNSSKIIEAHGGSISMQSTKGIGTSFTIQIPKKSITQGC